MIRQYQNDMMRMVQKDKVEPRVANPTPKVKMVNAIVEKEMAPKVTNPDVNVNPPQIEVLNQPQKEIIVAKQKQENPTFVPVKDKLIEEELTTYSDFNMRNNGTGLLKIQASTAGRTLPVEGVNVVVSKVFSDGRRVFYTLRTDAMAL